ncbi:hypothetical protein HGP28_10720 [Vibrio sp. SM6]|uniref:Uncharacterized protein n=1 Tax=Vibrio agarilyticus TaxID=2726741 RepID=A0A7X8TRC7_9VIBR|nr:hypothetical protein [Vibrio agarilyticus]NLS13365.1 hypothetical protein [Vibrio agarilyticus]
MELTLIAGNTDNKVDQILEYLKSQETGGETTPEPETGAATLPRVCSLQNPHFQTVNNFGELGQWTNSGMGMPEGGNIGKDNKHGRTDSVHAAGWIREISPYIDMYDGFYVGESDEPAATNPAALGIETYDVTDYALYQVVKDVRFENGFDGVKFGVLLNANSAESASGGVIKVGFGMVKADFDGNRICEPIDSTVTEFQVPETEPDSPFWIESGVLSVRKFMSSSEGNEGLDPLARVVVVVQFMDCSWSKVYSAKLCPANGDESIAEVVTLSLSSSADFCGEWVYNSAPESLGGDLYRVEIGPHPCPWGVNHHLVAVTTDSSAEIVGFHFDHVVVSAPSLSGSLSVIYEWSEMPMGLEIHRHWGGRQE